MAARVQRHLFPVQALLMPGEEEALLILEELPDQAGLAAAVLAV
jgi:hypothetical protein